MALVQRFADKVRIVDVYKGCHDKQAAVRDFAQSIQLQLSQVCFIGDDVNDLPPWRWWGCPPPLQCATSGQSQAALITAQSGGFGAVREVIDKILGQHPAPDLLWRP